MVSQCPELAAEGDGGGEAQGGAEEDADGAERGEAGAGAEERETAPLHALQDSLEHTPRLSGPAAVHTCLSLVHFCADNTHKKEEAKRSQSVRKKTKNKRKKHTQRLQEKENDWKREKGTEM